MSPHESSGLPWKPPHSWRVPGAGYSQLRTGTLVAAPWGRLIQAARASSTSRSGVDHRTTEDRLSSSASWGGVQTSSESSTTATRTSSDDVRERSKNILTVPLTRVSAAARDPVVSVLHRRGVVGRGIRKSRVYCWPERPTSSGPTSAGTPCSARNSFTSSRKKRGLCSGLLPQTRGSHPSSWVPS